MLRNGQGQISLRNDAQPMGPGRPCKWSALCLVPVAGSVVSAGCAGRCGTTIACSVAFDASTPWNARRPKWRARTLSSRALRLDRPVRRLTVCALRRGASFRGLRAGSTGCFGTTSSGPRMSLKGRFRQFATRVSSRSGGHTGEGGCEGQQHPRDRSAARRVAGHLVGRDAAVSVSLAFVVERPDTLQTGRSHMDIASRLN